MIFDIQQSHARKVFIFSVFFSYICSPELPASIISCSRYSSAGSGATSWQLQVSFSDDFVVFHAIVLHNWVLISVERRQHHLYRVFVKLFHRMIHPLFRDMHTRDRLSCWYTITLALPTIILLAVSTFLKLAEFNKIHLGSKK
mmetsp:Transcript_46883/g.142019  ORF Transcript_46883/g.142019 Transcript_46883/m.142019 type:complete len:143 (+) Transcript_46883:131-559(+)